MALFGLKQIVLDSNLCSCDFLVRKDIKKRFKTYKNAYKTKLIKIILHATAFTHSIHRLMHGPGRIDLYTLTMASKKRISS